MGNSNIATDNNINDIESYKNRIHLLEEKNNILQNEIDEIKKMINEKKNVQETYKTEYEEKFKLIADTFGDIKSNIETILNKKKNKNSKSETSESSKSESEKSDENIKEEIKEISKKKKSSTKKEPSGFTKPVKLSDELADFINVERGTKLARTETTRHIIQYIRNNGLQDKTNPRIINVDEKLNSLLKLKPDDVLSYFNLQTYLRPHFIKD